MILSAACLLTGCAAKPENESSAPQGTTEIFAIAEKYEIYVMPTLMSFDHFKDGSSGCDELWYRYDLTREATNKMAEIIPDKVHPLDSPAVETA